MIKPQGIDLRVLPTAVPEDSARMDVAGFVGFASAGPLDTPVVIHSESHFREVFGKDQPLAWDPAAGQMEYAYLGSAVRSFFRGGGQRCWVVRVARDPVTNRFPLAGLVRAGTDGLSPAYLVARSPGSWSDRLGVRATVQTEPIGRATYQSPSGQGMVEIRQTVPTPIHVGDLLHLDLGDPGKRRDKVLYLAVTQAHVTVTEDEQQRPISLWRVVGEEFWLTVDPTPAGTVPRLCAAPPRALGGARRVTLTLQVKDESGQIQELTGLGLTPRHPRYLGHLPTDEQLFEPLEERRPLPDGGQPVEALWEEVTSPRFPLAADGGEAAPPYPGHGETAPHYLPLSLELTGDWNEPVKDARNPLERDGLSAFTLDAFLDPLLKECPAASLMEQAMMQRHMRRQRLRGIHALLPVTDATLIGVPDSVHTGWEQVDRQEPRVPQTAPELTVKGDPKSGRLRLTWGPVPDAAAYTVQTAADPDFAHETASRVVDQTSYDLADFPHSRYVRVRAMGKPATLLGPWSSTVTLGAPPAFHPSVNLWPPQLAAQLSGGEERHLTLTWTGPPATYTLQMAYEPDFRQPMPWYTGPATSVTAGLSAHATAYFRVRALDAGVATPWSNTVVIPAQRHAEDAWQTARFAMRLKPEDDDRAMPDRLAFHRALLRLCLARGDLFAVLSLPYHYKSTRMVDYVRHLTESPSWADDMKALSFGALYYPWVMLEEEPGSPRRSPPDGPVTGLIGAQSLTAGPWSPPAYKLLTDVTELPTSDQLHTLGWLLDEGINVLVERPEGGVLVRSAHSLTSDPAIRAINVRRLLGLLRRLVIREGSLVTFEPNDDAFRRSLQRRFEQLLVDLFVRGAFAGDTPAESFEVVIDPAVNTPTVADTGQVIIDLKVAPVQPLIYMTLRIVQAPGTGPSVQEV